MSDPPPTLWVVRGVFVLGAVLIAIIALAFSWPATAQEVLPDENLLQLACDHARDLAEAQHLHVKSCRQYNTPDVWSTGVNRAAVAVRVVVLGDSNSHAAFIVTTRFQRSLWSVSSTEVVYQG